MLVTQLEHEDPRSVPIAVIIFLMVRTSNAKYDLAPHIQDLDTLQTDLEKTFPTLKQMFNLDRKAFRLHLALQFRHVEPKKKVASWDIQDKLMEVYKVLNPDGKTLVVDEEIQKINCKKLFEVLMGDVPVPIPKQPVEAPAQQPVEAPAQQQVEAPAPESKYCTEGDIIAMNTPVEEVVDLMAAFRFRKGSVNWVAMKPKKDYTIREDQVQLTKDILKTHKVKTLKDMSFLALKEHEDTLREVTWGPTFLALENVANFLNPMNNARNQYILNSATFAKKCGKFLKMLKGSSRRRMAQRELSSRRDSPVMVRLLNQIVEANERHQRKVR